MILLFLKAESCLIKYFEKRGIENQLWLLKSRKKGRMKILYYFICLFVLIEVLCLQIIYIVSFYIESLIQN